MADKLFVGNVEVLCLTDVVAPLPFPLTELFPNSSEAEWDEFKERYPENFGADGLAHFHIGSYLIRSGGQSILVDTGVGPEPIEMMGGISGTLPTDMQAKGVDAGSIDQVFHTHLHFDHVGWNMDGGAPRFPNARYVATQADWDFLQVPEVQANFPPGSFDGPIRPLKDAGVLDFVTDGHSLTSEVTAIATPGHTPGHMSVLINSGGEKALITGDALVTPAQITNPHWTFGFDADPAMAVETRTGLIERMEAEGLKVVGCHFPSPGYGSVVRLEGKRYWQGM